jgi:hypothetical protein
LTFISFGRQEELLGRQEERPPAGAGEDFSDACNLFMMLAHFFEFPALKACLALSNCFDAFFASLPDIEPISAPILVRAA